MTQEKIVFNKKNTIQTNITGSLDKKHIGFDILVLFFYYFLEDNHNKESKILSAFQNSLKNNIECIKVIFDRDLNGKDINSQEICNFLNIEKHSIAEGSDSIDNCLSDNCLLKKLLCYYLNNPNDNEAMDLIIDVLTDNIKEIENNSTNL